VSILGSNYLPELLKHVDAAQIPSFMGGTGSDEPESHPAFDWVVDPHEETLTRVPSDDPFILAGVMPEELCVEHQTRICSVVFVL
jgi:hypothetical protein